MSENSDLDNIYNNNFTVEEYYIQYAYLPLYLLINNF